MKKFFQIYFLFFERYFPDPFVFALILTLLTLFLGVILTENSILKMIYFWGNSFWELLTFGMQMVLILVTGGALAETPVLKKLLKKFVNLKLKEEFIYSLVALISMILAFFNWGLSLIGSALLVKEIGKIYKKENKKISYSLLCASAYTGLLVWHGGLSGSAPLTCATKGHFLEKEIGIIPISKTIFSFSNLILFLLFLTLFPVFIYFISKIAKESEIPEFEEKVDKERMPSKFLELIENSPILPTLFFIIFLIFIFYSIKMKSFSFNLNTINLMFLFLGIFLHGSLISYIKACVNSVKASTGIIIQFPFYAGIMGMMRFSGLIDVFSKIFVLISDRKSFPFFTFLSAGIVNLFIPSGGGQWAVQGPIMINAGKIIGTPLWKIVLALAYGDEWTNMVQPFWALPIIGITKIKVNEIIPYTFFFLIFSFFLFSLILLTI